MRKLKDMSLLTLVTVVPIIFIVGFLGVAYLGSIFFSSGTVGNVRKYSTNHSKQMVYRMITGLFAKDTTYRVPDGYASYKLPYRMGNDSLSKKFSLNADTANFFFFDAPNRRLVWAAFSGLGDHWTSDECILSLVGYVDLRGGDLRHSGNMSEAEQDYVISFFESEIMPKIDSVKFVEY